MLSQLSYVPGNTCGGDPGVAPAAWGYQDSNLRPRPYQAPHGDAQVTPPQRSPQAARGEGRGEGAQILRLASLAEEPLVARACLLAARDPDALHAVLTRPALRAELVAVLERAAPRLA